MKYTVEDEARYIGVLKEIQNRIPPVLLQGIVKEKPITPKMKMVIEHALKSETFPQEKKQQLQNLWDSGMLDKVKLNEDPKKTKLVDEFVQREINKEIKAGRLPPRHKIKYLPSMRKIINETKNKTKSGE